METTTADATRPLRILHLDAEMGFRGGERQVQLLVHGLRAAGHEQLVAGPEGGKLLPVLAGEGFATAAWKRPWLLGIRSPFLKYWMQEVADRFRPDIVHAHTGNAHTLAVIALLERHRVVVTRRVDFPIKANSFSRVKYTRPGQHYIAISHTIRDVLVAGGVAPERIDIVHSGVDVARVTGGDGAAVRREWLGGDEGPVIGFVGALVDHKAPWVLAEAARLVRRELPGARVVFVGDGELRPRLEEMAADSPPGTIVLAGWREDMANCLAAMDLFVMPSKLEGLCTSLIDALAAGVPAVASRAGGIPDVVVDGETGDLVPPLDAGALAAAIVALWRDPARRERYRAAGRARVESHFTAAAMIRGTQAVYHRVMESPPG